MLVILAPVLTSSPGHLDCLCLWELAPSCFGSVVFPCCYSGLGLSAVPVIRTHMRLAEVPSLSLQLLKPLLLKSIIFHLYFWGLSHFFSPWVLIKSCGCAGFSEGCPLSWYRHSQLCLLWPTRMFCATAEEEMFTDFTGFLCEAACSLDAFWVFLTSWFFGLYQCLWLCFKLPSLRCI